MKILIVHNTLNDSKSLSGALRHFLFMANEWTASGHQTDFLIAKCAFPQISAFCPNSRLISSDNIFDATNYVEKTWRYFPAYAWRMLTPHFTRLQGGQGGRAALRRGLSNPSDPSNPSNTQPSRSHPEPYDVI